MCCRRCLGRLPLLETNENCAMRPPRPSTWRCYIAKQLSILLVCNVPASENPRLYRRVVSIVGNWPRCLTANPDELRRYDRMVPRANIGPNGGQQHGLTSGVVSTGRTTRMPSRKSEKVVVSRLHNS